MSAKRELTHFGVKVIKKSNGQSIVAKGAYNNRANLRSLNTGNKHYHKSKGGLVHSVMLTPSEAPEWLLAICGTPEIFFSHVEKCEVRKDAQYMREVTIGLPHELSDQQNVQLARAFVQETFVRQGMVANLVVHKPTGKGDQRNIHAHVLLTMREILPNGFGKKVRQWNRLVSQWRDTWENVANGYLARRGLQPRVKMKSFKKRKIKRVPSRYEGPKYTPKKKRERHPGTIDIISTLEKLPSRSEVNTDGQSFGGRGR
nr:MobA/MobL family protein [uncultured Pseudodesulfovibrio sp.]